MRKLNPLAGCAAALLLLLVHGTAAWAATKTKENHSREDTYEKGTIISEATHFFGSWAKGIAKAISKVFADQGQPDGYIEGREVSGALGVGARYGDGELVMKSGARRKVHWTGPSIGFDAGGDAVKVFTLVYHLKNPDNIYQRFPAVDGSLFWIAGVSVNYQQSGDVVLAPMRLGVGLRAGANIGYMHYRRHASWNPF
jgi:hypothetical protein